MPNPYYEDALTRMEKAEARVTELEGLLEYLAHDSWRCGYHQECLCGLDALTDALHLSRIPYPEKN